MKYIKCLLLLCSVLAMQISFAQDVDKKQINSGYVFIDGKYIKPPYTVKRLGLTVRVNGKKILKMSKPESPYDFKKRPQMPIDAINTNSGLDEIYKIEHPVYNKKFIYVIESYFLEKYRYEIACDSIKNTYKSLPNVESVENYNNNNDHFQIVSYNGEYRIYSLSPYGRRYNQKYGPKSKTIYSRDNLILNAEGEVQSIKDELEHNKMLFLFTAQDGDIRVNSYSINEKKSHRVYEILQSDYDKNKKVDSLNNIFIDKDFLKRIVKEYQKNEKVKNRFENDNSNKRKINGDDTGLIMPDNNEKSLKNQSYSPQNTEIMAWCPCPWDSEFEFFNTNELPNIVAYVENQGYNYNPSNVFTDESPCDNYFGTCDYDNLLSMRNAGLLYFASHGHQSEGIDLIYAMDSDAIDDWCSQNSNIQAVALYPVANWDYDIMWTARANSDWATQNWSSDLQQNNTLSVLSCCYSYTNGWVDACKGGICFGYDDETEWNSYFQGIEYNNRNLFKRMNGEKDNASKREAVDAYLAMPDHKDSFTYNSNSSITLCPTITEKYPAENVTVASNVQSGYIKFDTWCDASEPADQALSFSVQNGDIFVYNVEWDGNGAKSNQINFDWGGTFGEVTVNVNPEYILAYNGGQRLDYDGVTPNNDSGNYGFTVDDNLPTGIPQADFTWSTNNYTVNFSDLSANNPTSWLWDFDDGTTSINQNPTHVYSGNGSYNVTLTVSNSYGTNSISKSVQVNSSANTFEISGKVYGESFNEISGATVSGNGMTVNTDANGNYSIFVDAGWSGSLTANAPGYESNTQPFNAVYVDKEHDFYLNNLDLEDLYISSTNEYPNQCPYPKVKYKVEGGSGFWDYEWYLNGSNMGTGWFKNIGYFNMYNNILKVEITTDNGDFLSLIKEIYVTEECQEGIVASISQDCDLINKGTIVHFFEESTISDIWADLSKRNWRIDQGGDDEIITEKKSVDEIYPYDYSCSFDHIGHKVIKLSYWECYWLDFFNNYNKHVKDVYAGVNVIDCDLTSTYSFLFPTGFTNAVRSNWAYENWGGNVQIYGGSFEFNGLASDYLSQTPTTLSACNEIIINGDVEFVADGENELILEIKTPCNYNDSRSTYSNNQIASMINVPVLVNAKCYPNPFHDKLNIYFEIESDEDLTIEIFDMNGKLYFIKMRKFEQGSHLLKISMPQLKPAAYVVKLHNKNLIETFKVIKH